LGCVANRLGEWISPEALFLLRLLPRESDLLPPRRA
jgi:hypothetical protein